MLYAKEDPEARRRQERKLLYVCRSCSTTEEVESLQEPVFRKVVAQADHGSRDVRMYDVAADPTLPRTYDVRCANCAAREAVYFQAPVAKNDEALVLYFVCTTCAHRWLSSDKD